MLSFNFAHRSITAGHGNPQRLLHDRRRIDFCKESLGRRMDILHALCFCNHIFNISKVLPRRTAAVVAHPPENTNNVLGLFRFPFFNNLYRIAKRRIVRHCAICLNLTTIQTAPNKLLVGKSLLARVRAHENIAILTALFDNLNKPNRMPKGVEIDCRRRRFSKLLLKIALALLNLADEAFTAWHIAIRLKIPTAHDMPFPCFHKILNPRKQRGRIFFDVFIDRNLVMTKYVIKLFGEIYRRLKGRQHRADPLLPIPLPNRVEMSVTNQMHFFHSSLIVNIFVRKYYNTQFAKSKY